jgi:DNA-binding NtrC family response regulator
VRELGHAIERAVAGHRGGEIEAADLRLDAAPAETAELRELRDGLEQDRIVHALVQCRGIKIRAARLLDVSQDTLIDRMRRHGLLSPFDSREPEPG